MDPQANSPDPVSAAMMAAAGKYAAPEDMAQSTVDPVAAAMLAASRGQGTAVSKATANPGSFSAVQALASMGGGLLGSVVGGYRGLYDLATGKGVEQAAEDVRSSQERFTPSTNQATADVMTSPKNPLNWIPMGAKKAGEFTEDVTGSPVAATAVETGLNALPMVVGGAATRLAGRAAPEMAAADVGATVDKALTGTGLKSADLSPPLLAKLQQDAGTGALNPDYIKAQAEADSVGTNLTKGQLTRDPAQFSLERNQAKVAGGEPYANQFTQQDRALSTYLNENLGAGTAPTQAEAGQAAITKLAQIDQQLDQAKNAAYDAVKDSQGRSATLDPEHFYLNAETKLAGDNSARFLPSNIASVYGDITDGKLPFTVDTMTSFDKILSRAQRSTEDGNATHAIGLVRSALNETPVSSEMGQQAIQAYQTAKGLARQQFSLADPASQSYVPGYSAMLKGMGNASHSEFLAALENGTSNANPAGWFKQNIVNATPASTTKLMNLLNKSDAADTVDTIQKGTIGAIRDQVMKGNPQAGTASVSGDALSKMLASKGATLGTVLPADQMASLGRLSRTAERIQRPPPGNAVNTSNTAPALINMAKEAAGGATKAVVGSIPVVGRPLVALNEFMGTRGAAKAAARQAQGAVNPSLATPTAPPSALADLAAKGAKGTSLATVLAARRQE